MNPITDKQLGWISSHILRELSDQLEQHKEMNIDRTLQYAEKWCLENLDLGTASDTIATWKKGNREIVINQLRHLGLKTKDIENINEPLKK